MHSRRSIRLNEFDYGSEGWYFITICALNRRCIFGRTECETVQISRLGQKAVECWQTIPEFFPWVSLDEFVIMPNHVHGIICIADHEHLHQVISSNKQRPTGTSGTIGSVIRGYKTAVTKWARMEIGLEHVWQRNYWEHVIRGYESLTTIREYVINNPLKWDCDSLNPRLAGANHIRGIGEYHSQNGEYHSQNGEYHSPLRGNGTCGP